MNRVRFALLIDWSLLPTCAVLAVSAALWNLGQIDAIVRRPTELAILTSWAIFGLACLAPLIQALSILFAGRSLGLRIAGLRLAMRAGESINFVRATLVRYVLPMTLWVAGLVVGGVVLGEEASWALPALMVSPPLVAVASTWSHRIRRFVDVLSDSDLQRA